MSYTINVLNPSLAIVGTLQNIKNVEIYEVINNQYVADVEIAANTFPSFLQYPNILEIDNDYFMIADIDKQRDSSKSIKLSLEHISYKLNDPIFSHTVQLDEEGNEIEEFYEGDVYEVIQQIWGGIDQFNVSTNVMGGYFYYRPSASGGRSRIQEFARQNGLEVEYNKFNIYIFHRRGANKGLELRVGENVRSVSQKISLNDEFYIEYAHEVDIIDFSKMPGQYHTAIASAEIGDTVRIIDTDLAINASERIVAKRYNPMFKQIPKLDVGQVMRDIVNVINKDEEEEEKEEDPTVNYFLQSWRIGNINCMALSGIELEQEALLPEGISTSIDYYIEGEHKGMSLAVKSQYSNYHIYIGEWYEDNRYEEYKLQDVSSVISTWNFPKEKMQAISITICEVPIENYDPEIHKLRDYGIKFNKVYIDPLREFKIGKNNVLGMNPLIDLKGESIELDDFSAKIDYHLMQEYEGVKLSLRREFDSYSVMIITMDADGVPQFYDYNTIKDQLPSWKLPREDAEYLLVSISEVPNSEFDPAIHKTVQYGVKFEKVPFEPLYELRIGEVNCLQLSGVAVAPNPALNTIQAEIFYKELNEHIGLRVVLLREYRSYHIKITTYDEKGKSKSRDYNDIIDWTFPRETVMYIVVGILEVPPDEFDSSKHKQAWYAVKFTEQNNEIPESTGGYYMESETVKASGEAQFDFTIPYNEVVSVTLGVGQVEQEEPVTAYWSLIEDETEGENMYTGVLVDVKGLVSGEVDVSMQAVCYEAPLELEEDPEEGENDG